MLNKNRSGKLARLKYLAVLPLCAGMLCASTLVFSKDYGVIDLLPRHEKPITKPDLIKYFKIRDRNITAYSDNLSFTEDGVKKTYLAATITNADIAYIKKVRKIDVEVIEVDSKTKMQVPMAILPDAKPDTTKMPPPPIALKSSFYDFGRFISIKTAYPKNAIAGKNQGGLIINFHVDGSGNVSHVKLSGKKRTSFDDAILASASAYRGKITDKAGDYILGVNFIIPGVDGVQFPKPSVTNAANYVGEVVILGLTDAQRKKLMPPPPLPPTAKPGNVPALPPPPPPAAARPGKPAKPDKAPALPPPPPPALDKKASNVIEVPIDQNNAENKSLRELYSYLGKSIRYPKQALATKTKGRLVIAFTVSGQKMANIKIVRGIDPNIDNEVTAALKSFPKPIGLKPRKYTIPVLFIIDALKLKDKSIEIEERPVISPNLSKETYLALNEIVVVGYAD